ncbi:MAG: choice-of-anchor D domain-containing protein [Muribaculaceae bacterium]|nr:choice-of-anchor D domain-containing protein [Muribaculaceae bacterium]
MTRILRLLLIAAVAWPLSHPAAAQEAAQKHLQKESVTERLPIAKKAKVAAPKDAQDEQQQKNAPQPKKNRATKAVQNGSITVCDGTGTDEYFPVYGYYFDYGTSSQMIYPASGFNEMSDGDQITQLTFYPTEDLSSKLGVSTVTLRLGETTATTVTSSTAMTTNRSSCTQVFSGTLTTGTGSSPLTITLTTPYTYHGGNLIVDFVVAGSSSYYNHTYWYGVSATSASYCVYGSSNSTYQGSFLPKMKVDYTYEPEPYAFKLTGDGAFGDVKKNNDATKTFTLKNTGENDFTPVMTITGDQEFTVTSAGSGALASGAERVYTVTFAPSAVQSYSATLTLTAQESEASVINTTVQLSGTGVNVQDLPVADGTTTNGYVPNNMNYFEAANHGQIIYTPDELGLTPGSKIYAITFHANSNLTRYGGTYENNTVTLKLGETTQETYSTTSFITTGLTTVATNSAMFTGTKEVTFTLSTPYEYQGGNLIVDATSSALSNGAYASSGVLWVGQTKTGASISFYSSNSTAQRDFQPKMTLKVEMAPGTTTTSLDFGTVEVGSTKTLNANVANPSTEPVTATVTATAPFSVQSNTVTLASSEDGTTAIPVTFTPTSPSSYRGTLTVVIGDETITIPLSGIGNQSGVPCTRDSVFFAGIEYDWTDSDGGTHTSGLDEIATDPDQIIAMLKEVYTNKSIPGNYKRGYTTTGGSEAWDDVYYSGIGSITRSSSGYNSANYYSYNDKYGWNIPGTINFSSETYTVSSNNYTTYCAYLDTVQYKPNQEGVTLLLLEMTDNFDKSNVSSPTTSYNSLRDYIVNSIKSARVVTDAKRTGIRGDYSSGTLFKIDCEKMNKFFLLAKGQLRWFNDGYEAPWVNYAGTEYIYGGYICGAPCYLYSRYNSSHNFMDQYNEDFSVAPFYHMFEQFSPVTDKAIAAKGDIYQDLINMDSFGVIHDCMGVSHMNHQFMMYGDDSEAADCQDVQDMMFFVPDYRMMYDYEAATDTTYCRDVVYTDGTVASNTQKFRNYNRNHQPTMGLYVIRQDAITTTAEEEDYYMLQLNWRTNLDDFLPSDEQEFELFEIKVVDGVETMVPVYYMNSQGQYLSGENGSVVDTPVPIVLKFNPGDDKIYSNVYVKLENGSKEVTYVIRGRDTGHFLSLQYSNKQSYIIPGLDPNEMIRLTNATYYSRYNPQTEKNCYSNKLSMANNAIGINNNKIVDGDEGTKLLVNRSHTETIDGVATPVIETIATITFNNHATSSRSLTVTMANQSAKSEYPNGKTSGTAVGYHANNGNVEGNGSWTYNYSVAEDGNIVLSPELIIYDNFVVDVSNNEHPANYTYKVETNYVDKAVYLDVPNTYNASNPVWYAYTWSTTSDSEWIPLTQIKSTTSGKKYKFNYNPAKTNVIFCRVDPSSSSPLWSATWNQTTDLTVVENRTYTITGWGSGENAKLTTSYEDAEANTTEAYSSIFRVPVYKTGSEISSFTEQQVLDDVTGLMSLPDAVTIDVDVQRNSKTELYRYDVYRWKNTAANRRYIIDSVNGEDEEDLPPDGIAGNQGETYSVSMNEIGTENYLTSTASLGANGWGVAKFEDLVPGQSTVAAVYDYAPVVETLASGFDVSRGDYNTYGGPIKSTAVGTISISVQEPNEDNPLMSDHTWTSGGKTYAYYNINLKVDTKTLPDGYDIYMIRAWREIDESLLGEEYEALSGRISNDVLFEEIKYPDYDINDTYVLGSQQEDVTVTGGDEQSHTYTCYRGTFGAQKLRTDDDETGVIDELDATFTVRIYFTKNENLPQTQGEVNGAPALRDGEATATGDGRFYIMEDVIEETFKGGSDIPTGVFKLDTTREVVGVKYYNVAGIESDTPFKGVNIVVTRYSDGSSSTTKILK